MPVFYLYFIAQVYKLGKSFLLLEINQWFIVKLLIETLDLRNNAYMPVLHVLNMPENGKQDFTVNLPRWFCCWSSQGGSSVLVLSWF